MCLFLLVETNKTADICIFLQNLYTFYRFGSVILKKIQVSSLCKKYINLDRLIELFQIVSKQVR